MDRLLIVGLEAIHHSLRTEKSCVLTGFIFFNGLFPSEEAFNSKKKETTVMSAHHALSIVQGLQVPLCNRKRMRWAQRLFFFLLTKASSGTISSYYIIDKEEAQALLTAETIKRQQDLTGSCNKERS